MYAVYGYLMYEQWETSVDEFAEVCAKYTKLFRDTYGFAQDEVNTNPEAYRVEDAWCHDTTKLDAEIKRVKGLIDDIEWDIRPY